MHPQDSGAGYGYRNQTFRFDPYSQLIAIANRCFLDPINQAALEFRKNPCVWHVYTPMMILRACSIRISTGPGILKLVIRIKRDRATRTPAPGIFGSR